MQIVVRHGAFSRVSPSGAARGCGGTCFAYTGPMAADAKLELVHVTKRYGDTTAVDRIDLRIAAGSYCCLLGPSGCGKTSTLRMIAGHEAVTEGDILIGGAQRHRPAAGRRGTAMMFQSYALFPHLSCARQRRLLPEDARRRQGGAPRSRRGELLELRRHGPLWPSACRRSSPAASSSAWRWRAR